ncbi:MAG: AI-2E family transporter [Alphaproteobacteria bacterium]|nr:AI-2E family transporter [Alphaproteobacteria bacterium]
MDGRSRTLTWLAATAAAGFVLYVLRDVLLPFAAGVLVAYVLDPLVNRLVRRRIGRGAAAAAALVLFFLSGIGVLLLIAPVLQAQIVAFAHRLPAYVERARAALEPLLMLVMSHVGGQDPKEISQLLGAHAGEAFAWLGTLLAGLLSGGAAIAGLLSLLFITPVVAFYLLRDWDRIVDRLDRWLPRAEAATIRVQVAEIDRTLAGFARGQALVCLALAAWYAAGLTMIGLDFGLLVGIFAGLASFIPIIGALVGGVLALALALVQFPTWGPVAAVVLVFAVGQVLEGQVLTPRLVGDRVGLHPVWIIFALMVGGASLGFLGLLLAVPVAAAIGVLVRFALERYLASPFYRGPQEPV